MVIAGTILLIIGVVFSFICLAAGGEAAIGIVVISFYFTIPGIIFLSIGSRRNNHTALPQQNTKNLGLSTQQNTNQTSKKEYYLTCPVCGYQVFEDYKCCPHCETKLEFKKVSSKYCTNCGKELDEVHKFCPYCGKEKY